MALCILYWLMQQFQYFLSERKFNRDPTIPDFSALVHHVHTKMLGGFLGQPPTMWLEQVQPTGAPPPAKATPKVEKMRGAHNRVTNTNYNNAIKKRWEAGAFGP